MRIVIIDANAWLMRKDVWKKKSNLAAQQYLEDSIPLVIETENNNQLITNHIAYMEKNITYKNETGTPINAFVVAPDGQTGKLPAVILIHEIFGLDNHIRNVARQLSREGYLVVAPHLMYGELEPITDPGLFARLGPHFARFRPIMNDAVKVKEFLGSLPEAERNIFATFTSVTSGNLDSRFIGDLRGAFSYLVQNENVNPAKVGSMGFCFGGGMVGLLAVNIPQMAAHIVFYGKRPPADKIKNITAPVLGLYGGLDTAITSTIPGLAEEMKQAGKKFRYIVYENAMHAFFNDARPQVYNKEAAVKAWEEVKQFFKENLHAS